MCITCKKYPRLIKKYNNLCEKNLVMLCPEVARLLCEHRDPLDFVLSEEELNDWELLVKKDYVDKEIYDLFFEVRSFYIDIIQYRDISLWKRLYFVLRMQDEVKKLFESKNNKGIENIIQRTKQEIDSEELLKELDKIEQISQVSHVKIRVLSLCILNDISKKELNESYEILSDFIGEEEIETVNCRWVNIDNEYNEKYKMYDYIYENYIVYYLYENYFKSDKDNIIGGLIISYMLLKAMNLLKYIKYGKIDINDIKENIYNLSRLVDNSKEYFNEIIRKLGERGLWTKEYLLILMR
ncbi:flagellin lysine-N-methylase [Clostridium sp. MSJ-8]|nr:flagellin lysine-N-methylase [Clostridium sp. MSJ-8]MBU5488407.1 flagellin lysine-N-methylase [Clostridium sp. MSJ-8]